MNTRKRRVGIVVALTLMSASLGLAVAVNASAAPVGTTAVVADTGTGDVRAAVPAKGTSGEMRTAAGYTGYAGYVAAGAYSTTCWQFNGYSLVGPIAVIGEAANYNVAIATIWVNLEHRSGVGWAYCVQIRNQSGVGSDVNLDFRFSIA